ncbi:hypothetical protein LguiA_035922 [Lonicera macranthoides]
MESDPTLGLNTFALAVRELKDSQSRKARGLNALGLSESHDKGYKSRGNPDSSDAYWDTTIKDSSPVKNRKSPSPRAIKRFILSLLAFLQL